MATERLYLRHMHRLENVTRIESIEIEDGRAVVILEQSPFYPQGGGQPCDHGLIEGSTGRLLVDDVRVSDAAVVHKGAIEGSLRAVEAVTASVDADRRRTMSRLHSAGHVVDLAVMSLGWSWIPGKGYHFPDGPYVEYSGGLEGRVAEDVASQIEAEARRVVAMGCPVTLRFVRADSDDRALRFLPPGVSGSDEVRVVEYGSFAVPCGGTHVSDLAEIGGIAIRKVREKKGNVRVSYEVRERD